MPENKNNHPMKEFVRELTELQPALRAFVRDLLAGASQTPDGFQGANLFTPGTHFRARAFKGAQYGVLFSAFCLGSALSVRAAQLVHEPFDYSAGSILTSQTGGSGWTAGWTVNGQPCVIGAAGLSYVDGTGKILNVSGKHADTTGTATTRNFRTAAAVPLNNVWISFLYQLPTSNARFKGVTRIATARGLMLIDHHPNGVALQQSAPATFQSFIADGVHPNAQGIDKITFPMLQWKLSGGLPLP